MTGRGCLATLVGTFVLASCSAPQPPPPPDPRVLMRRGDYGQAVAEAERQGGSNPTVAQLALLAAARSAQAGPEGPTATATADLERAVARGSRGAALAAYAAEVSGSMAFAEDRFIACTRVVEPVVQAWGGTAAADDVRRGAVALLELAAYGAEHRAPVGALEPLLHQAELLLAGSTTNLGFPEDERRRAWGCFRAAGSLAASTDRPESRDFALRAATLAVLVAEANENLAIAITCDYGSPRDRLREVLRRQNEPTLLQRFSAALERAEGCTLGAYAP